MFHDVAGNCLEFGIEPWGFVGCKITFETDDGKEDWREFTKEMATKMLPGLDLVWSLASAPGALLYVEKQVSLEEWIGPDEFGTSDAFIIDILQRRLIVFDWKWGAGVPVHPEWNDQAILYLLGVWSTYARKKFEKAGVDPSEVEVVIIIEQPRAPGGGGVWKTQLTTLLAEGKLIRRDAAATEAEDPAYNPGPKQCQFCAAAKFNTCRARAQMFLDLLEEDMDADDLPARIEALDEIELRDRRALTPEERGFILLNQKLITNWLSNLHEEAMEDAKKGLPTPGQKRVAGRNPPREWQDENKATYILIDRFGEDAWKKKLLSPAMVEDEVGVKVYREHFARHVTQGDAKPILVPEADPRPPLKTQDELLEEAWDDDETDETVALI